KGNEPPTANQGSGQPVGTHTAPPSDAAARPAVDCSVALREAMYIPSAYTGKVLIEGCKPCGDWAPLLNWSKLSSEGGPTRKAIEDAMVACNGYCNANGKMRFLGALDRKRGDDSRLPWRMLGQQCGAAVSAVPDARYMSAPYFALDRIARHIGAGPHAMQLEMLDITLPAVSSSGAGLELPESPSTVPAPGEGGVTVTMTEVRAGKRPYAKLSASGVTVMGDPYPGEIVGDRELPATLDKLGAPVVLFAPRGMKAARLAAVAATAGARPFALATLFPNSLEGWQMYGVAPTMIHGKRDPKAMTLTLGASADAAIEAVRTAAPTALSAPPTIAIGPDATVESLAKLLDALSAKKVPAAAIAAAGKRP
ncbi:MAG: hypothetical protein AB7O24_34395, partial [Kofleriaceae bacterium]